MRELFSKPAPERQKRTRFEMMKGIDADYYGYRDDDDGVLDITPWTGVLDSVSLIETCDVPPSSTEWAYSDTTVGPDGIYVPGGVYRCFPDGTGRARRTDG